MRDIIRPFEREDADRVTDLWNRCLLCDRIEPASLLRLLETPNYDRDGVLVTTSDGEIVGFIAAIIRKVPLVGVGRSEDTGWILNFFARPDHYATGVGAALLDAGLDFLRSHGRKEVLLSFFHEFYFFAGMDARHVAVIDFLESQGFERTRESSDVVRSLVNFQTPQWVVQAEEALRQEGITFDYCRETYRRRYLTFMREHFPGVWYLRAEKYVAEDGDPERKLLALRDGEVIGFISFGVSPRGSIGETGVLPSLRRKHIGSVLVYRALDEMIRKGAEALYIGGCPLHFYKIVEGEVVRTRVGMRKRLG